MSCSARRIKLIINVLAVLAVSSEFVFFQGFNNLLGCLMLAVSCVMFNLCFSEERVKNVPFMSLAYFSYFMYRFLPVPAMLMEFKPVSYALMLPMQTFLGEALQFVLISMAYLMASWLWKCRGYAGVGLLRRIGAYDVPDDRILWAAGLFGLMGSAYIVFVAKNVGVSGSFDNAFRFAAFLVNAPSLLLFPGLVGRNRVYGGAKIWMFISLQFILALATNSRTAMVQPFLVIATLAGINYAVGNGNTPKGFPALKVILILIVILIGYNGASVVSSVMLQTRNMRSDMSRLEMLAETVDLVANSNLEINPLEKKELAKGVELDGNGWSEQYLDNFLLSRFANIRVTDVALHHALRIDERGSELMRKDFFVRIMSQIPTKILSLIGLDDVKSTLVYSRGDLLVSRSQNGVIPIGFRVIADFPDGFATFGVLYVIIMPCMYFVYFAALGALSSRCAGNVDMAISGLLTSYWIFLAEANMNGVNSVLLSAIRGIWSNVFICAAIFWLMRKILINFKQMEA